MEYHTRFQKLTFTVIIRKMLQTHSVTFNFFDHISVVYGSIWLFFTVLFLRAELLCSLKTLFFYYKFSCSFIPMLNHFKCKQMPPFFLADFTTHLLHINHFPPTFPPTTYQLKILGGIPYTDHGAQITPPPYFLFCLFFVFMLILGQVR